MLYAKGFENSFLDSTQGSGAKNQTWTWYVDNPKGVSGAPLLKVEAPATAGGTHNVFTPKFIGNSNTPSKWSVIMFYGVTEKANGTQKALLVDYRIYIKDNYSRTDFITRYDGSFWVPRFQERAKMANVEATRKIEVVTSSRGLTEDTMRDFCTDSSGTLNTKAYNSISADLEGTSTKPLKHYTKIKYTWG